MRITVLHYLSLSVCCAAMTPALAQYKYAEPGKSVTYSDQPPPPNAKLLKLNNQVTTGSTPNSALPYELQQAVQNFPVVLYTMANCAVCDEGRNYLHNRGIPHTEKTVKSNEDIEVLKRSAPDGTLPVLLVGKQKSIGYSSSSWGGLLSDAGYPASSKLPRNYQFAEAESAAPGKQGEVANAKPADRQGVTTRPAPQASTPASNTPPGFKF